VKVDFKEWPEHDYFEVIITISQLPEVNTIKLYAGNTKEFRASNQITIVYQTEKAMRDGLAKIREHIDYPIAIQINVVRRQNAHLLQHHMFKGRFT